MNNIVAVSDTNIDMLNFIYGKNFTLEQMIEFQKSIPYTRILKKFEYNDKLKYPENEKKVFEMYKVLGTFNCHFGQLKLFYALLEFMIILKMRNLLDDTLILYIGSATGSNIYAVSLLFPNIKWLLYDPSKFDDRLFNSNNITIKTGNEGFWSLDKITEAQEIKNKLGLKYIAFISDIRIETSDKKILQDNLLNLHSILLMDDVIAYELKNRFIYYDENINEDEQRTDYDLKLTEDMKTKIDHVPIYQLNYYAYIGGKIYFQIYGPPYSVETRLIGFRKNGIFKLKNYDIIEYERKLLCFNFGRKFFIYKNIPDLPDSKKIIKLMYKNKIYNAWAPTYENITEVYLAYNYFNVTDNNFINLDAVNKYKKIKNFILNTLNKIPHGFQRRLKCSFTTMKKKENELK